MMHSRLTDNKGGFLLEALIATVILGFGLTAVIRSLSLGLDAHRRTQEYLKASILLENKLTEFLLKRYFDEGDAGSGEFDECFSQYRYEVSADKVEESDLLRQVNVKILWPGKDHDRFLEASTYLFKRPNGES